MSEPSDPSDPPAADAKVGLRVRAEQLQAQLEARRDDARRALPPVDIFFAALERDTKISGFLAAGAIAFRLFVYILPLYLLGLVVAGATFSADPASPENLARSTGMSHYLAGSIGDAAERSNRSLWVLVPVTLWALSSAGLSAHKALAMVHSSAWGLPERPKAKAWIVAPGFLGFALVLMGLMVAFGRLRDTPIGPIVFVIAAGAYFALWMAASLVLPRPKEVGVWHLVPGALLVAAGSQGLYLFNVLYLNRKIASASAAYGALGVAASALLWLYLLGRVMVAAPVLNATMWERRQALGVPKWLRRLHRRWS